MKEQTVLITGASRGIGLEIAKFLKDLGYRVIGTSTNSQGVQLIDQELGSCGKGIEMRIDNDESVAQAFSKMEELEESPCILINNAGITGPTGPLWEYDVETWNKIVQINLMGTFNCCRAIVPNMIKHNYGRIVNVCLLYTSDAADE